jgi:thiol-disulfide isomerase/thioredoxin
MKVVSGFCLFIYCWCLSLTCSADDALPEPTLHLDQNQFVVGRLIGSTGDNELAWQCRWFDRPLLIDASEVRRIESTRQISLPTKEAWAFDLRGGDCLIGNPVKIDANSWTIDVASVGDMQIESTSLVRMRRLLIEGDANRLGLTNLLAQPSTSAEPTQPKMVSGRLTFDRPRSEWRCSLDTMEQRRLDLRLGWEDIPEFEILFDGQEGNSRESSARIEVWDRTVVAVQRHAGKAEIVRLTELDNNETNLALSIFIDSENHSFDFHSSTGEKLGLLKRLTTEKLNQVTVRNFRHAVVIENFTASHINRGIAESSTNGPTPDRLNIIGAASDLKDDGRTLFYRDRDGKEFNVATDSIISLEPLPTANRGKSSEPGKNLPLDDLIQIHLIDGSRITGSLSKAAEGSMALRSVHGRQFVRFASDLVLGIKPVRPSDGAPTTPPSKMQLQIPGVNLYGTLVEAFESQPNQRLQFHPFASSQPIAIREDGHGSLRPTRPTIESQTRVWRAMLEKSDAEEANTSASSSFRTPEDLQLRTGDVFKADIHSIDAKGVVFKASATEKTFLPNDLIRSVQLKYPLRGIGIDAKKMERLLTVPRLQRESPPTHLVITTYGDYIRGRLIRLTDSTVEMEDSKEPLRIPREIVSVIVWLYERTGETEASSSSALDANEFYVHVRTSMNSRFTVMPKRFTEGNLEGKSPWLGELKIPFTEITAFGKGASLSPDSNAENPWRLTPAKSPLVYEDVGEANAGNTTSDGSGLLGRPATNFELSRLDGTPWRLGDQQGKVIVLDFWASWCGPCIHGMPLVEGTVRDFERDDCLWVGVNIAESEIRARSVVERLQLEGIVLLDELGAVAQEYQATAIPLVLVIDKKGIIRAAFVGSDEQNIVDLKRTIQECFHE